MVVVVVVVENHLRHAGLLNKRLQMCFVMLQQAHFLLCGDKYGREPATSTLNLLGFLGPCVFNLMFYSILPGCLTSFNLHSMFMDVYLLTTLFLHGIAGEDQLNVGQWILFHGVHPVFSICGICTCSKTLFLLKIFLIIYCLNAQFRFISIVSLVFFALVLFGRNLPSWLL